MPHPNRMPFPKPARGIGFFPSLILLASLKARETVNLLRFGGGRAWSWAALLLALGAGFFWLDYWFFLRLIGAIILRVEFLAPFMLQQLIHSLFLTFFGLLALSTLSTSVSGFYMSREIPFLLTSPLSPAAFISQRFLLVFIQSAWMVIVFGIPPFLAYKAKMHLPDSFLAGWFPVFFLLLLAPSFLGSSLAIVLMRFLPARRVKQVLTFVSLAFAAVLILLFRMSRPERLFMDVPQEQVMDFIQGLAVPSHPYMPTTWAATAVSALGGEGMGEVWLRQLIYLGGAAGFSALLFFTVFHLLYGKGISTLDEGETNRKWRSLSLTERLLAPRGGVVGPYLAKDLLLFARDPGRWTQLFLLGALVVLYVYNANYFPTGGFFYRNLVAFLNLGITGFVLSALCVRFVFPSISMEGSSVWITLSAPVPHARFFLAKYLFAVIPLTGVSLLLTVSTNLVMNVSREIMFLFAAVSVAMVFALVGLNLGMGALFPRFRYENEAQVSVSPGGLMAMILSLAYVVLMVVFLASPVYHIFAAPLKLAAMTRAQSLFGLAGAAFTSFLFAVVPLRIGLGRAERWLFPLSSSPP